MRNQAGLGLANSAGVLGRICILFALVTSSAASADPFAWVGAVLDSERPLSVASQRRLSQILLEDTVPGQWRERIIQAFAESPVRDAQTALWLLQSLDRPANRGWRGALRDRLDETSRTEFLGFYPHEREALEKGLIALANAPEVSLFARRRALRTLVGMGLSRHLVSDLGPLPAFRTQELKPLFLSRPERNAFAEFWLMDVPDLVKVRAVLGSAERRMSPNDFLAGLISVLGHPHAEVRKVAGEVLETALRTDTAFPLSLLPSENQRLQAFFQRYGSAPYVVWRMARNDEDRLAILDRLERSGDLRAREDVARAYRWEQRLAPDAESPVRLRAEMILGGCREAHSLLRK